MVEAEPAIASFKNFAVLSVEIIRELVPQPIQEYSIINIRNI
jgi:hypothetical protein